MTDLVATYRLQEALSWNSAARTFAGRMPESGEEVAVKVISLANLPNREALARRFVATASTLRSLSHETLPEVLDFGVTDNGEAYLVTRWFPGAPLDQLEQSPGDVLEIMLQVVEALQSLSLHGLVHLGLSPDNVLVMEDGRARLTGWGSSLLNVDWQSARGAVLGVSNDYTAPELMAIGGVGDALWRADLFSVASMTAELLGAEAELSTQEESGTMVRFPGSLSLQISSPEELRLAFQSCLALDPDARPDSYSVLSRAMQHAMPRSRRAEVKATQPMTPIKARPPTDRTVAMPTSARSASRRAGETGVHAIRQQTGTFVLPKSSSERALEDRPLFEASELSALVDDFEPIGPLAEVNSGPPPPVVEVEREHSTAEVPVPADLMVPRPSSSVPRAPLVPVAEAQPREEGSGAVEGTLVVTSQDMAATMEQARAHVQYAATTLPRPPAPSAAGSISLEKQLAPAGDSGSAKVHKAAAQEPVAQEPVSQEPIAQEPVARGPVVQGAVVQGEVVKRPEAPAAGQSKAEFASKKERRRSGPSETLAGGVQPAPLELPPLPRGAPPPPESGGLLIENLQPKPPDKGKEVSSSTMLVPGLAASLSPLAEEPTSLRTREGSGTSVAPDSARSSTGRVEAVPASASVTSATTQHPSESSSTELALPPRMAEPNRARGDRARRSTLTWLAAAAILLSVAGVLMAGFLRRDGVRAEPPPSLPDSRSIVMPSSAPLTDEVLPEELQRALTLVGAGDWSGARPLLVGLDLRASEGELSAQHCEALQAAWRTLERGEASVVYAGLKKAVEDLDVNAMRGFMQSSARTEEILGHQPGGDLLYARARTVLRSVDAFRSALDRGDGVEPVDRALELEDKYPALAQRLNAVPRATARARQTVLSDLDAQRWSEAQSLLAQLEQRVPFGPSLVALRDRLKTELEATARLTELMDRARALGEEGRPHDGIGLLARANPPRGDRDQVESLRSELRQRMGELDRQTPQLDLVADGLDLRRDEPLVIELIASDDYGVIEVVVEVMAEGRAATSLPVRPRGSDRFEVEVPAEMHNGKPIQFWATAVDRSGHRGQLGTREEPIEVRRKRWFQVFRNRGEDESGI